jgi:hypothetical protein
MEPTQVTETSEVKTQMPGKFPEESTLESQHGESLKTYLLNLYGEDTTKLIRLFENLRIKKTKLLSSLTFLLRCRDHNTIPQFLQFHHLSTPERRIEYTYGLCYISTMPCYATPLSRLLPPPHPPTLLMLIGSDHLSHSPAHPYI